MKWGLGNFSVNAKTWYPTFLELSEMKLRGDIKLKLRIIPPNESEIMWTHYYPLKHYDRLDLLKVWEFDTEKEFDRELSCKAAKFACSISSNGDVFGCNLMSSIKELCAGNVKFNSFESIWNDSKVFMELRNLSITDLSGKCKDCENDWCGGGCRSNAYNLTGSICGSDITCFKED
ncbi:MAG: SPASM domain-containing protein [Peptoanaerobacter stomatis]|uniref:SPASM domain-containing protein n=1 Tax=Peptoanaerobacter stomatis TaxID=796937 RepID=UPI003FA165AC